MSALEVRDLVVAFGKTTILEGISFRAADGEAVAILGPSGSGKTTLLYTIAGFVTPLSGEVRIGGQVVADADRSVPPEQRSVGFVFQNYALWPHLTAVEIVAYSMLRAGMGRGQARREAISLLDLVGIGDLAERRPAQLSGGQQQRVGLARALARRPRLYLFDEPTAHLDSDLRSSLQEEMVGRRRAEGATAVYATHDAAEALAVADRVVVVRDGRVVQIGTPEEIYARPVDLWAARLTGPAWALDAELVGRVEGHAILGIGGIEIPVPADPVASAGRVKLVIRPDWLEPGEGLEGRLTGCFYRGPHTDYRIETAAGVVEMRRPGGPRWRVGDVVGLQILQGWPVADGG